MCGCRLKLLTYELHVSKFNHALFVYNRHIRVREKWKSSTLIRSLYVPIVCVFPTRLPACLFYIVERAPNQLVWKI